MFKPVISWTKRTNKLIMNTEEKSTEELEATPAEVEQEVVEEAVETTEESIDQSAKDITDSLAPKEEEVVEETVEEEAEEAVEESTDETTEETVEEVVEEVKEVLPADFVKSAKELYPDKEFKTDSEVYQAVIEETGSLRKYKEENDAANTRVMEVLNGTPEVGEIIKELDNGATFLEALALHVDIDALKPAEGEPDHAAWKKARVKRKEQAAEYKKAQDEIEANIATAGDVLETFRASKEMSKDEVSTFAGKAKDVINDIQNGKLTDKFLEFMYDGMNHKAFLAESREQGEIKGRNEKIVKGKAKKTGDDGLPGVKSQGQPAKVKVDPAAQAIVDYQKRNNRF